MPIQSVKITANPVTAWEQYSRSFSRAEIARPRIEHRDIGGYWSFKFSFHPGISNRNLAADFLSKGMMRHVEVFNEKGKKTWEGYISRVSMSTGTAKIVADVDDMSNRVFVRYNDAGTVKRSTTLNNADSQGRYGIKERVLTGGEINLGVADQMAQQILDRTEWPSPGGKDINLGGQTLDRPTLEIDCRGYWHTLSWRTYNQTTLTTDTDASIVIGNIVGNREGITQIRVPAWNQVADGEEGDETDWDAVVETASGTLNVSTAAALTGVYGWAVSVTGLGDEAYGRFTDPTAETFGVLDWRLDPNGLTMATNDEFLCGTFPGCLNIWLGYNGTDYYVYMTAKDDGGGDATSADYIISDAPHDIRAVWAAASAAAADDGFAALYIDGALKETLSGIDNDTKNYGDAQFGARNNVDTGTSGTFYIDDCRWSNTITHEYATESGVGEFIRAKDIDDNTTQVTQEYDADRTAGDIIKSVASLGDGAYHKWNVGVGDERTFYFKQAARPER